VVQIELFAASSGSSIRSVFGIHKHLSDFSSPWGFESLECFPRIGEPPSEHVLVFVGDDADKLELCPSHCGLHAPLGQGVTNGQKEGVITGNGIGGPQKPGGITGTIGGTFHWALLLVLPCSEEFAASAGAGHTGAAMVGMPFHAGLHGYTKGGPGKHGMGCMEVIPLHCPITPFWWPLAAPLSGSLWWLSDVEGAQVWVSPFMGCAVEAGLALLLCSPILSTEAIELHRGESGPSLTAAWFPLIDNG
jgi:hypothetical protein